MAAKEHGVDRLRYCDTLGYDNPFTIYETAKTLAEKVCMPIELHCHGDLGMAVANSIAGAKGRLTAGRIVISIPRLTASAKGPVTPTWWPSCWQF